MVWQAKYWDVIEQLYWTPKYLGLQAIPKSEWGDDAQTITLPRARLTNGAALYTRVGTARTNGERLRALEEPLNHIFEITFGIAADAMIGALFHSALGIVDQGPFERIGREARTRYGWGSLNVTQQDALFVSPASMLAVEIKLGSPTSPEQVMKYLCLLLMEELHSGPRAELGLLYITPNDPEEVWRQAGVGANGMLPAGFVENFNPKALNTFLQSFYLEHKTELISLVKRTRLAHLSWQELAQRCKAQIVQLDISRPGDATLARLLGGFVQTLHEQVGTKVEE